GHVPLRWLDLDLLFELVRHALGIHGDAGAHGGGQRHRAQVCPLGRGGLGLHDGLEEGHGVGDEVLLGERLLAHLHVNVACLVHAEFDLARLHLAHRAPHVEGDGAQLGIGHEPTWAPHFAQSPHLPPCHMRSGVPMVESKSMKPPWIFSTRSSAPTTSAPASRASRSFSPLANTATRTVLPMPWGNTMAPRTIWSACLGSTPKRRET